MSVERLERVHQHATNGHVVVMVSKARQGHPTDDMSSVVVTKRAVVITIERTGPIPGLPVSTDTAVVDLEHARDLGQAIFLAADELLAEQAKDDQS